MCSHISKFSLGFVTSALIFVFACQANAAAVYSFSFANVSGNVSGTVDGSITLDFISSPSVSGTGPASKVQITSVAGHPAIFQEGDILTLWQIQGLNSFTVTNGVITDYQFGASEGNPVESTDSAFCLNNGGYFNIGDGSNWYCDSGENYLAEDNMNYVQNLDGISGVTFSSAQVSAQGPILERAEATCGLYGGPPISPTRSTSDEVASCSALGGAIKGSADLPNAQIKVFADKLEPDPVGYRISSASVADLITVTDGWDANGEVSGTFDLDVQGAIEVGAENVEHFIALWYPPDPGPPCVKDMNSETRCDGFPYEGPYDYAQVAFVLQSALGPNEMSGGTGMVAIQSIVGSNLQATLSIPWTVTRANPSFHVAISGSVGTINLGTVDFFNTNAARGSFTGPVGFQYSGKTGLASNLPGAQPKDSPADLGGRVKTADGTDVCAMVLASGRYMFSCDPIGTYSLPDLPREPDGSITRQVYADGFFPVIQSVKGSVFEPVVMQPAFGCPKYNPPSNPGQSPGSAGKRHSISGRVLVQDTETPVCSMVLANAAYTFSCDATGSYSLDFPLDSYGQYTLQVYADGFAPTIQTFDETNTGGDVRMARTAECD